MIICSNCGRDIDAIGQDNVSYDMYPLCEECARKMNIWFNSNIEDLIDFDYE